MFIILLCVGVLIALLGFITDNRLLTIHCPSFCDYCEKYCELDLIYGMINI